MNYDKLPKVFYKRGQDYYENEFLKRKGSYGCYLTRLNVKGFRKGKKTNESYQLFYLNIHELMLLNNKVLLNSSKISTLICELPDYVLEPYFHKLIVNEAQSNNEIEGIRSTKKELKEALDELIASEHKYKRFKGLMKTYLYINQIKPFTEIADFRELYDNLVADEIGIEDAPDGELFRNGYVEINDGTQTSHIGIGSEEEIIEALNELRNFLDDQRHPELYRFMVAHYYYEYIHPFYDGNGRTGRLLVCSYLARYLERYSAITFSYAINKSKSLYYKALEEIASPLNRGEMTFYLMEMLELLSSGQEGIIEDLELNLAKLERINAYFTSDRWSERQEESHLLRLMTSLNAFVNDEVDFPVANLMKIANISRYKLNQIAGKLEDEGYIKLVSQRPKTYVVTEEFLVSILVM